jgi:hypothetical protein
MFKKLLLLILLSLTLVSCVDGASSGSSSYRPTTSITSPNKYITITKSNFSQYFSGTGATPDNSSCTYAGCKLPATYSFTFSKKSNFKIDSSIYISFTGTASLIIFHPNLPQSTGTGNVSGSMTMSGNSSSFSGKFTVSCASAGCGAVNVRIATPGWDISTISGRIYF